MSGWGLGWFGGGAAKQKDAPKKAILQLREQLEMLSKREKHLQNQMAEQQAIAAKNVTTNKNGRLPFAAGDRMEEELGTAIANVLQVVRFGGAVSPWSRGCKLDC